MNHKHFLNRLASGLLVMLVTGPVAMALGVGSTAALAQQAKASSAPSDTDPSRVLHKTIEIDGLDIFYREEHGLSAPSFSMSSPGVPTALCTSSRDSRPKRWIRCFKNCDTASRSLRK